MTCFHDTGIFCAACCTVHLRSHQHAAEFTPRRRSLCLGAAVAARGVDDDYRWSRTAGFESPLRIFSRESLTGHNQPHRPCFLSCSEPDVVAIGGADAKATPGVPSLQLSRTQIRLN